MGIYAVTGSASGMGKATAEKLRAAGHRVVGVDLHDADVTADLSTAEGRNHAIAATVSAAGGRLDGAVLAAGLGPTSAPGRVHLIAQVNYFGVVELLEGWRPALADAARASGSAKVVVFGSNSSSTVPAVPGAAVDAFLAGDGAKAERATGRMGRKSQPAMTYAASKIAVARWVRRQAVTAEWAGAGIRLNAIAPGAVATPLLESQLATPEERKQIEEFPVPIGGYGDAQQLADWVVFMLGPSADFLCGSVVFVDGGTDAYFNADEWPHGPSLAGLPGYLRRARAFKPFAP